MTGLVDECRKEWKRLGVPGPVADEMAAELEADLEEAESEGASAKDLLGPGVLDPRSFAASWAIERGVVVPRRFGNGGRRRFALAAFVTVAVVVMIGASAAILTAGSGEPALIRGPAPPPDDVLRLSGPSPGGALWVVNEDDVSVRFPTDDDLGPVGWVLLGVGLAGLVPAVLLWSSQRGGRAPDAPT